MASYFEKIKEYDEGLSAFDKRFRKEVYVEHIDGSKFEIKNAFLMHTFNECNNKIIILFSEHFKPLQFLQADLVTYFHVNDRNGNQNKARTELLK